MEIEIFLKEAINELHRCNGFKGFLEGCNKKECQRIQLLQAIFADIDAVALEELKDLIYQYGSMIGEKDVIARKVFLVLLRHLEEKQKVAKYEVEAL